MDQFSYRDGQLCAEQVAVADIAREHGTPAYVYSRAAFEGHYRAYDRALAGHPHLICYAVKANSNLAVLNVLTRLGAGFDIVSAGELERVLRAGGDPGRVVFSGVGKQPWEMRRALEVGVRCFNVESDTELDRLNQVAGEHQVAGNQLATTVETADGAGFGLRDKRRGRPGPGRHPRMNAVHQARVPR